ncbi:MAG: choice-of-anchor I family protein [Pirellulales bacterium]|nr:choice-of-anchor I family protein [Pirellulales bacterium]
MTTISSKWSLLTLVILSLFYFATPEAARAQTGQKELVLHRLWTHSHGQFDKAAAEVVVHSPSTKRLYVSNAAESRIDVLDIEKGERIAILDVSTLGKPTSVAVTDRFVVTAVAHPQNTMPGSCVFFDLKSGKELWRVPVGAHPDMVAVTPDGNTVLVANEGEPNEAYSQDPHGSISVIDFTGPQGGPKVRTIGFEQFDPQRDELIARGVRITGPSTKHPDRLATVAEDLEPEYIAISADGRKAWVTLQENNAIAVLDIEKGHIENIVSCGLKDHSQDNHGLDVSDRDGSDNKEPAIQIAPAPVWGLYQPDAIVAFEHQGNTFLLTANEGDSRKYDGYRDVKKAGKLKLPDTLSKNEQKRLSRFEISVASSDQRAHPGRLLCFGGRSFSIRDSNGKLIFDSGDQIEKAIAARWPTYFNSCNGHQDEMDQMSCKQGPEPEAVTVGAIDGRTYAFIALEKASIIVIYDISDPEHPGFSGIHMACKKSEDCKESGAKQDDHSMGNHSMGNHSMGNHSMGNHSMDGLCPETMAFIPTKLSPTGKPLLAVAYEVSGTTALYEIRVEERSASAQVP